MADVENQDDFARIAAVASGDSKVLAYGSAGLAEYVASSFAFKSDLLVISGSVNTATLYQIAKAQKEPNSKVIEPDLSVVLSDEENLNARVEDLVSKSLKALAEGRDVVITLAKSKGSVWAVYNLGEE